MFALTVKNGHTRIYLTEGTANPGASTGPFAANFWRTDNANQPAATLLASQAAGITVPAGNGNPFPATYNTWQKLTSSSTASPYYPTIDFCTGQCWYDQNVYTPAGLPDTVYVIGSYTYGEIPCNTKGVGCGSGRSNGRAVIYSTTAGDPDATATGGAVNRTFTDLTFDAQNDPSATWCALGAAQAPVAEPFRCLWAPNSIHPDEHVIAVNPSNPTQIFQGSDGAMIRTSGTFSDISFRCNSNERPTLGAASLANCARLLSRVPTKIDHIDTNYSSTLQFINVAINPLSTCEVMGGTQDNGTWSNINNCDTNTFWQVIYGDGGNAGYDKTTAWRFNEFTSGASDSNFKNGDPEKWVITSAPVVRSGEGAAFYWPLIADPNPVSFGGQVTHPTYSGAKHVWRSWAFGAGVPGHVPQDTSPDIAGYESNCQEFTVSSTNPACGDNRPLGGPYCEGAAACVNAPGDLTGTVYGADRAGGSISFLARTSSDHGTLWAATGAGRLFVTHNADAADPADGDVAPDRQRELADPVPERDLRRPGRFGSRVGLLLGVQRDHADHAGTRVRRPRERRRAELGRVREPERRAGHRQVPDPVRGRRSAGERRRPRRRERNALRVDGLRRAPRRRRRQELARHEGDASLRGDAPRDAAVLARRHLCAGITRVQPRPVRGNALAGHLAHGVQVGTT